MEAKTPSLYLHRHKEGLSNILLVPPLINIKDKNHKSMKIWYEKYTGRINSEQLKLLKLSDNATISTISREFPMGKVLHIKKYKKGEIKQAFLPNLNTISSEKISYSVSPLHHIRFKNNCRKIVRRSPANICYFDHTVPDAIVIKSKSPL